MDQYINVSDDATFMCEATGSPPISYQWFYNGMELMDQPMYVSGASTNTLMVTNANVSQWGNYNCVASNEVDSATSDVGVLQSKQMVVSWCMLSKVSGLEVVDFVSDSILVVASCLALVLTVIL